eukprot:Rhum_TRINITY_DN8287_c0_g2::Rhum_TRINITY_DN8287_c0_g2_i1::g.27072::m.27072
MNARPLAARLSRVPLFAHTAQRWRSSSSGGGCGGQETLSDDVRWLEETDPQLAGNIKRFISTYKESLTSGAPLPKADVPAACEFVQFREFDTDGDGRVSREEFKQHGDKLFDIIDGDRDGVLLPHEFDAFKRRVCTTWMTPPSAPAATAAAAAATAVEKPDADAREKAEVSSSSEAEAAPAPTTEQLLRLSLVIGVPMVGFGFVDNFLMILCGEAIEHSLGTVMALSTLAAAGLGNMCSDVAGLGLSRFIEESAAKMGLKTPNLTVAQASMRITRSVSLAASLFGVSLGCLLGMVPLLFFASPEHKKPVELEAESPTEQVITV